MLDHRRLGCLQVLLHPVEVRIVLGLLLNIFRSCISVDVISLIDINLAWGCQHHDVVLLGSHLVSTWQLGRLG